MHKLRHIAIATNDPKATAEFYKHAFGFEQVGQTSPDSPLATGYFLSDGTLNIAVLKFKTDQIGKGMDFTGVHHFGILVDDADKATAELELLGAECFMGKDKGHGKGFFEIKLRARTAPCSTSPSIRGWAASRTTREHPGHAGPWQASPAAGIGRAAGSGGIRDRSIPPLAPPTTADVALVRQLR